MDQPSIDAIARIVRPLVQLLLKCGISCAEFNSLIKSAFVEVITEEYGLRGRPTNISRVATLTGLSRREVRRLRDRSQTASSVNRAIVSPVNAVIHFWHYDPDFTESPGNPASLRFDGPNSFTELVRRYGGDIPASALKKELISNGTVIQNETGKLEIQERFFLSQRYQEEVVQNIAFTLRCMLSTVVHNLGQSERKEGKNYLDSSRRRFERIAWTDHMAPQDVERFKKWVSVNAQEFLEEADDWLGENELPRDQWSETNSRSTGVGVYFFENG